MQLPAGQQVDTFLNNTELKDAVRSTVQDTLSSLVDESTLTGTDAAIWEVTQQGFDEFLDATSAEEAAQIDTIDGIVSINGDIAEVLIDSIAEAIALEIENNDNAGFGETGEVPLPGIDGLDIPVWEPAPIEPITQEDLDAFNEIFLEGFQNMGTFRRGSRSSARRLR